MKKDMILSLNGDTFETMKNDFDTILARTIGNMTMKGADDATITLKLSVSLEKSSIGSADGVLRDVTKPTFKHDISSVMQVKDKMTGQFKGEYGMIWDEEEERWVLRKIDNGQMNLFDEEDGFVDADYTEVNELPALPAGVDEGDTEGASDINTPFGWLRQFIGEELRITEAMGNYTARTADNKVVLSSATGPDSPFYCAAEMLEPHVGHQVVCVGYGQGEIANVSIECEDCHQVIFDLDAPKDEEETPLTDEEISEAMDAAAEIVDGEEAEDTEEAEEAEEYEYDSPEE